jgi:phage terminase large subunit
MPVPTPQTFQQAAEPTDARELAFYNDLAFKIDPDFVYPEGVMSPAEFAVAVLGMVDLYDWQALCLEAFGQRIPVAICAANGSGKTQRVVCVAVLWLLTFYPNSVLPVTSGSWTQLEHQLWPALVSHSHLYPNWDWRSLRILTPEGGDAFAFSTNEPGRAEGYHGDVQKPLGYIIDEAKTVPDGIYHASNRCSAQYRMISSSAGGPTGFFFDVMHKLRSRYYTRKVLSSDCSHLKSKFEADSLLYPHDDPVYRSMHFSEFGLDDNFIPIVSPLLLRKLYTRNIKWVQGSRSAFCDFAAGGAENVLALRDGNRVTLIRCWRQVDTVQAVREFIAEFKRLNLIPGEIWGDEGGLGHNFLDAFREQNWYINGVNNASVPRDEEHFANLGSETWFTAARKIERGECILPEDPIFFEQATSRKREYDARNRLRCEGKEKMAKSPDRADAVFGALYCQDSGARLSDFQAIGVPENPFIHEEWTPF